MRVSRRSHSGSRVLFACHDCWEIPRSARNDDVRGQRQSGWLVGSEDLNACMVGQGLGFQAMQVASGPVRSKPCSLAEK